jgi:putative FmdB family regulatory protein
MPIYAYRCAHCGHTKDVLQKISDTPLTTCPACGQETFSKQITAAGFQLKGSGWYVTDFRGGSNNPSSDSPATSTSIGGETAVSAAAPTTESNTNTTPSAVSSNTSCAPGCGCH